MRCKKCGCELAEDAKFCIECGSVVKEEAPIKFCSECGRLLDEKTGQCNYCMEQKRKEIESRGNKTSSVDKKNRFDIFLIAGLSTIILLVILGIGIISVKFLRENTKQEENVLENQTTGEQEESEAVDIQGEDTNKGDMNSIENKTETESASILDDKTAEEQKMENTTEAAEKEFTLKGVEAGNKPDYNICTNPDNYQKVEVADGEFSFRYPEGFFNHVEKDGEDYVFTSEDGKATLIVRQKKGSGDAILDVQTAYSFLDGKLDTDNQETGIKLVSERIKEGWAHCIYSGTYFDDANKAAYFIGVSNGRNVYTMDFEYYEPDTYNYYTPQNYMIDCLYRYCEHSGTSYRVRTYEQFLSDDMGEKK